MRRELLHRQYRNRGPLQNYISFYSEWKGRFVLVWIMYLVKAAPVFLIPILTAEVINLITNAINYNKKGGWCRLSVKEDGKDIIIDVNDSGIGISEKDMGRIWDRFFQADPARSGGGAGLGLPIVSILTQCHGGSVSAESREGEGSRFSVRIPKNP